MIIEIVTITNIIQIDISNIIYKIFFYKLMSVFNKGGCKVKPEVTFKSTNQKICI